VYNGYFCWRWFERDAEKFRVLTIEQKEDGEFCDNAATYRPLDLEGTNGYAEGLGQTAFCWRWFKRAEENFRVVTIEDHGSEHEKEYSLSPGDLDGINGYNDQAGEFKFCWRWFNREGENFRVVTLE